MKNYNKQHSIKTNMFTCGGGDKVTGADKLPQNNLPLYDEKLFLIKSSNEERTL